MTADDEKLMQNALDARKNAYTPYSGFAVGAALLTANGKIYCGCNIENSSFSPTVCAERVAFFKAISDGERKFSAIAVAGGISGEEPDGICAPCGVCRQVMNEFCDGNFRIILGIPGQLRVFALSELLPLAFAGEDVCKF